MCDHVKSSCEYIQAMEIGMWPLHKQKDAIFAASKKKKPGLSTFLQLKCHLVLMAPERKVNVSFGNQFKLLVVEDWACEEQVEWRRGLMEGAYVICLWDCVAKIKSRMNANREQFLKYFMACCVMAFEKFSVLEILAVCWTFLPSLMTLGINKMHIVFCKNGEKCNKLMERCCIISLWHGGTAG